MSFTVTTLPHHQYLSSAYALPRARRSFEGEGQAEDAGSLFNLQLPAAALALLFSACARSPKALAWLTGDPDRQVFPYIALQGLPVFKPFVCCCLCCCVSCRLAA